MKVVHILDVLSLKADTIWYKGFSFKKAAILHTFYVILVGNQENARIKLTRDIHPCAYEDF